MNFFCDSGGNIFHVDPENVYQGSANANTIYFIGAFASSCQVTVAFGLPNGVYTEPTLLTLVTDSETLSVNDKNGVKFNVWQVRLNGVVTENYGKVSLQFYVYGNSGNGQGACIASARSSFEVSKGVPITLPDDTNYPEESLLAQILAQLQRLQAQAAASTEAIEENTEAIVEVQKALEDKIKEFNGNLSGADARLQAEANGEVTIATIEINNPNTTLAFKNLEGMTEIDWGDGTINSELTHTYENLGVYYCRIYGLVSIGEGAFEGSIPSSNYTPITHIKISNKVTSIGDNAFTYTKLRSIEIPNSVTYIGSSFDSSHYLEKIVIPESVTYIDVGAFNMCANLKIVELKGAPPQQIYSGDIFSLADKLEKIIVPYGMVEAYKSASAWSDYATLIDCLVYQSDLDVSKAEIKEKITENREEINKDIKNLYAITAQGGLYTMLEVEQAFSSRETADGESIVDGQYTAPTKIQGSTVAYENVLKNAYFKGIKSTGKNLIPYPYYSMLEEDYGVTFSYFEDGKIQVNGSSTAPLYSVIVLLKNLKLPVGYYILSGCPSGGSEETYKLFLMIHRADGTDAYPSDYGKGGVVFYINEGDIVNYVQFRVFTGATASNLVVAPMINSGKIATAYEPYKEDIYELPEAVELGKWDYIDVENKKVVRKTYQLTVNGNGVGPAKTQIMMHQYSTTGVWSILCPFHGNEGGRAMTAGRDGVVVAQNNICEYATITGGYPETGYTTLELVGVQVTTVEEAKALLAANPITFVYESFANSKITDLEETPERYQAWKNGSETLVQGDTDNSEYGAMPTVTTEYFKLTEV